MKESEEARFWRKVDRSAGANCCWPYLGCKSQDGYGSFQINKRAKRAHRCAYIYKNGRIPHGLSICHKCDNPICCNPSHLWAGTTAENMADKKLKNRQASGAKHGSKTKPESVRSGEANGMAKLTARDIPDIRRMAASVPYAVVGLRYGVTESTISKIAQGINWKHVT